ncbi:MAG: putative RDD family membrane protein YckC [Candidatus Aldehydirespiratoraceae bacterium]|jgi:uncharacterized RDD family membrane protein YckC
MSQQKSVRRHNPGDNQRRLLAPEAVYLRRMVAWSAVVIVAFVGIELIIMGYMVTGVALSVLAAVAAVRLRSLRMSR